MYIFKQMEKYLSRGRVIIITSAIVEMQQWKHLTGMIFLTDSNYILRAIKLRKRLDAKGLRFVLLIQTGMRWGTQFFGEQREVCIEISGQIYILNENWIQFYIITIARS